MGVIRLDFRNVIDEGVHSSQYFVFSHAALPDACLVPEVACEGNREAGRRQVNIIPVRKREHSRKPDEAYDIIESCSNGPFLELFARGTRPGWTAWGNQAEEYEPTWATYANHSAAEVRTPKPRKRVAAGGSLL